MCRLFSNESGPMTTEITRRHLITTLGAAAGAAIVTPARRTRAGQAAVGADGHFQSAARLRPRRAADDVFRRSRRADDRPGIRRTHSSEHIDQAAVDRRALGRGSCLEQPGAVPAVERHPEQPSAALARRRRAGDGVPEPVEQQQRQHVRCGGASVVVRAPDAARRAIRARRIDHGHRGVVSGQASQFAERRRGASRRQHLVHRSAVRRAAVRRGAGCERRTDAISPVD